MSCAPDLLVYMSWSLLHPLSWAPTTAPNPISCTTLCTLARPQRFSPYLNQPTINGPATGLHPIIWRAQFPPSVRKQLVTFEIRQAPSATPI
jgi:hypothetical protein